MIKRNRASDDESRIHTVRSRNYFWTLNRCRHISRSTENLKDASEVERSEMRPR